MQARYLAVLAVALALGLPAACGEGSLPTFETRFDQDIGGGPAMHSQAGSLNRGGLFRIQLTHDFVDSPRLVRAFVETGSKSQQCLATFAENDPGFGPDELVGLVVMCRPREIDGKRGVGVAVFLPPAWEGIAFAIDLTIHHAGVLDYRDPVPCPGEC